ncbi:hypothetical protein [Paenibacillus gansuensis]|uniref:Magnesium transporter MgtE intracellular domain-containing protein n=1 Tax=Paenibacillus gansuensis TaxID=306542 RepID=A0ABW5PCL6_9BACL
MESMETDKSSYSGFERFLFFLTPVVFTLVLVLVLLTMFNYDFKNSLLNYGNKIPLVKSILPDSKTPGTGTPEDAGGNTVKELKQQLAVKEAEMLKASENIKAKDEEIKRLSAQIAALKTKSTTETANEGAYEDKVKGLAKVYADMSPNKAAQVIQNLTLSEQVLVLSRMKTDEQTRILEKMDPLKAAEASILLKDTVKSGDLEVKALQERLDKYTKSEPKTSTSITRNDLASTIASMTPKSAAEMLLEMNKTNKDKVLSILNSLETAARSQILSEMTSESASVTAKITAKLGN